MTRCRNCGRAFDAGFLSIREFCSDGCKKDYEIKTRTLEGHDDSTEWKKNCLMLAEANDQTVPKLQDLLETWAHNLCALRKSYDNESRENILLGKLLEQVTLANSNLDPALLHEIRRALGDWTSERGEKDLEKINTEGPSFIDEVKGELSSWLGALEEMERVSRIVKSKVTYSL